MSGKNNPMYGSHRVGEEAPLANKVCINDGNNYFYVDEKFADGLLSSGKYFKGGVKKEYSSLRAEASRRTFKEKLDNGFNTKGYGWFKNPISLEHVYIKLSDIDKINKYINLGYVRGDLTKEEKLKKGKL